MAIARLEDIQSVERGGVTTLDDIVSVESADELPEVQAIQRDTYRRPTLAELVDAAMERPRGPVQPPLAVEGAEEAPPAPTEVSQEDIEAQRDLPGLHAEDADGRANRQRRQLARLIEETLFTPSAAPVEGGKMAPLVSPEVAAVPLTLSPSRYVARAMGGKYPEIEADQRAQLAETISGFTHPDTLASLPGFIVPGVKEAFAIGQMARQPELVGTIKEAIKKHGFVSKETGRGIQDLVLSALMTAGAAHGGGIRGSVKQRTGTRWDQVSGTSPVLPSGPRPMPDLGTYGPPMAPQPGTIAGDVSRALERRFTLKDEPRPQVEAAPTVEEGLARTEQPPVAPEPTQADITRDILAKRQEKLARAAVLRPLAEQARKLIPGGERGIEAELAEIDAWLKNPVENPVVHAPPETGRTGVVGETARVAPEITAQKPQPASVAPSVARPEAPAGSGQRPAQQTQPAPPEHAAYVPPGTPVAQIPVKPGLVGTLETKAAEARARIQGRRGRMNSEAALFANLADEAVIGAYHIVRLGRDFGKWVAAMTKELGERSPLYWRQLYDKSITQLKEEGQKAEFLKEKAKESKSRLDLSKPENFGVVDQAIPIGEVAKNEEFLLIDSNGEAHRGMIDRKLNVNPELFDISPPQKQQYRRPSNLLGTGIDPKTVKGEKFNVRTFIMYLAAHVQAGIVDAKGKLVNICKFATKDCAGGCLGKGGMGTFDSTKIARANKTKFFHYDTPVFNMQLHKQITTEKARAQADGKQFAVRLNGTSDVLWEQEKISGKNLMELHPDVQFYDYTKYPATSRRNLPDNYHMTYSYTGLPGSDAFSMTWAERGVNTAVVFGNGMPAEFLGRPVIDGDVTDLRFRDPKGVIVGLHAKGPLLKLIGQSDFIYDTPPGDVAIPYIDPRTKARLLKNDMLGEDAVDSIKDAAPAADKLKYKRGNPFLGENVKTESLAPVTPKEVVKAKQIPKCEDGMCFGNARKYAFDHDSPETSVIHGKVTQPTGKVIDHAWVEIGDMVHDPTTGVSMEKGRWYDLTNAKPEARYTAEQATINQMRSGNMGPWTPEEQVAPKKGLLERKADEARANRAEKRREGRQLTGLDPTDLTDLAWIMADHINRKGYDRFTFEDVAMQEGGPGVAMHLDDLFKRASDIVAQFKATAPLPSAPQAPQAGTSKIGKSIEAKAVEAKLTQGFAETAGYDPVTIARQSQLATDLVRDNLPLARSIVRGEAPLPGELRGTPLITAMEERLLRNPDAQVAYELANSPLTSATSYAAQEMRLMKERVPDGIAATFTQIKEARAEGAKQRGETPVSIKADIFKEVVRGSKRQSWESFVNEIVC